MAAKKKKPAVEPHRGHVGINRKGKGWSWMVITPDGRVEVGDETYQQAAAARRDGQRVLAMARGEKR